MDDIPDAKPCAFCGRKQVGCLRVGHPDRYGQPNIINWDSSSGLAKKPDAFELLAYDLGLRTGWHGSDRGLRGHRHRIVDDTPSCLQQIENLSPPRTRGIFQRSSSAAYVTGRPWVADAFSVGLSLPSSQQGEVLFGRAGGGDHLHSAIVKPNGRTPNYR
jgi:hypothetical protein